MNLLMVYDFPLKKNMAAIKKAAGMIQCQWLKIKFMNEAPFPDFYDLPTDSRSLLPPERWYRARSESESSLSLS